MIFDEKFIANSQTIQEIANVENPTEEELDQFAASVAENVAEMIVSQPLTPEQGEALNQFVQGL